MRAEPIIGIDPDGNEYFFDSKYAALSFVKDYKCGSEDIRVLNSAIAKGRKVSGWTFRDLDNNEKDYYYEKVLRKQGGQEFGADPRLESGTPDSGE